MMLPRRVFNKYLAALPVVLQGDADDRSLRELASRRNIQFGSMVTVSDLADPAYAALVSQECSVMTPGIEAKWAFTEPAEGCFRFGPMDALAGFAAGANLRLHMHNLIWAVGLPAWTINALSQGRGSEIMRRHINALVGRYAGRSYAWDVINEPIDPRWTADKDGIVMTPWWHGMGPDFIVAALRDAAAADPHAQLMINDDDLEYDSPDREEKRNSYLRLIEGLKRRGVPLHAFGLETHLKPWLPIAEQAYRRFLHELAGFDLKLRVTEFDVNDRQMPADIVQRDRAVADKTRAFLDLVLDEAAVDTLIVWGLSDRATWMLHDSSGRRADGLPPRCLPYSHNLAPKPMRNAIASALLAARARPA